LNIGYQAAVDPEKQWNAWGMGRGFGGGMGLATSSTISNGTLVLDKHLAKSMTKLLKTYPLKQK
jgi:hypothetical protein